jgi:hypothetical protein
MRPLKLIERLGFDAFADDLIADALENLEGDGLTTMRVETADYTLSIDTSEDGTQYHAYLRCYVPVRSWMSAERTIKRKPRA